MRRAIRSEDKGNIVSAFRYLFAETISGGAVQPCPDVAFIAKDIRHGNAVGALLTRLAQLHQLVGDGGIAFLIVSRNHEHTRQLS
jgi:hypothetical protein